MNENNMSDNELLKAYAEKQDVAAFEQIHKRYAGFVYSACQRYLGNAQDAEDAALACFVALHNKAASIGENRLASWLHACAVKSAWCASRLRRHRSERESEAYKMEAISGGGKDLNLAQFVPQMEMALADLPHDQRDALLLRFYQRLSGPEIAERLGCAEGTVRSRTDRALKALRKKLARSGKDVSEDMITSGMASVALTLPVPHSMTLKLAAITKGEQVGGAVTEIARATQRRFMWAKVKVVSAVAAVVCGVALSAMAVISMLSGAQPGDNSVVPAKASTHAEAQVEIIYDDNFDGATLSDFWEKVDPTNQVTLNDPKRPSCLVLSAGGKGAPQRLKPEVSLVSRSIDLTKGIVEIVVNENPSEVSGSGMRSSSSGLEFCDERGNTIRVYGWGRANPGGERRSAGPKSSAIANIQGNTASTTEIYIFPDGVTYGRINGQRFLAEMQNTRHSVHLRVFVRIESLASCMIYPVDRITVRRLKNLPEDVAKDLADFKESE